MTLGRQARPGISKIALAVGLTAVVAVAAIAVYVTSAPLGSTTTRSSTSAVSVSGADLTIAMNPAMPLVAPGQTQNYSSIQVSSLTGAGPSDTLTIRAFSPAGISIALDKTSVSLADNPQSIAFRLRADSSLSPGRYRVAIAASSPSTRPLNQTFTIEVVPILVVIQALAFHPQNITVPKGTSVSWINLDSNIGCCDPGNHNVVFQSGANASSPVLNRLDAWSYAFEAPATVGYYCSIHPYMKGQITITG